MRVDNLVGITTTCRFLAAVANSGKGAVVLLYDLFKLACLPAEVDSGPHMLAEAQQKRRERLRDSEGEDEDEDVDTGLE